MLDKSAFTDVETLRKQARQNIEMGPVTPTYALNREVVLEMLNSALATEIVCTLRYKRHYFAATGIHAEAARDEFLQHAAQEEAHADAIAKRIVELGGLPNFSPEGLLQRSHAEYIEGETLAGMLKEDLIAERVAIESYGEMIKYLGSADPTTRRVLEEILATEEEHADDLRSLLEDLRR